MQYQKSKKEMCQRLARMTKVCWEQADTWERCQASQGEAMAFDTWLSESPLGLSVFFNSQKCPSLRLTALKWVFSNEDSYKDLWGSPGGWDSKESACNAEDPGLIAGMGRSRGVGNGNPQQYSCLENTMNREAQWATIHGATKSQTRLSN